MSRVCMIVHQYYHLDGRVKQYAESLAKAGMQVDVICLRDQNQPKTDSTDNIRIISIPLGRSYKNRGSYLFEYGLALMLFTIQLTILHIKNQYQAIHVHNMPDFLIFAALFPRISGAKLILDIHDPTPEFYMSKYKTDQNNLAVRLMRIQERLSAKLAHAIITANPNFKVNLIKRGIAAHKITIINNVADARIFNRNKYRQKIHKNNEYFTLIYPGTIAPRYGLDVAIKALPLLIKDLPQLRLQIIGSQVGYATELADLAQQLDVAAFVQFMPVMPINKIPQQITKANIGLYPALPDPHMSIATPTKVLEYAMMGIPIIASRLKVLEDLFNDRSIMFFEPGNANQLAQCILELYNNPARRNELVRNADHSFVHIHSWEKEQNKYFKLINRLLALKDPLIILEGNEGATNKTV